MELQRQNQRCQQWNNGLWLRRLKTASAGRHDKHLSPLGLTSCLWIWEARGRRRSWVVKLWTTKQNKDNRRKYLVIFALNSITDCMHRVAFSLFLPCCLCDCYVWMQVLLILDYPTPLLLSSPHSLDMRELQQAAELQVRLVSASTYITQFRMDQ